MYYIAIIADIVDSKKISNRYEAQEQLKVVLNQINEEYSESIKSKFTITLGDEFQGLLNRCDRVLDIIDKIEVLMDPIDLKFGIGIGEIFTEINEEISIGADGPAYWSAREALNKLKNESKFKDSSILFNSEIQIESFHNQSDFISSILNLLDVIKSGWKSKQRDAFKYIILNNINLDEIKLKELAGKMGISNQLLSERLRSMNIYKYLRAKNQLQNYLEYWRGK